MSEEGEDTHWDSPKKIKLKGRRLKQKKSFYFRTSDEIDLAITYYIPEELYKHEKFPVIFHQTRYYRDIDWRFPWNYIFKSENDKLIDEAVLRGYVFVTMDVRGSGASFGFRKSEWSSKERNDSFEVIDWILEQEWCDGNIGLFGNSYDGTLAEFAYLKNPPSINGIISKFSLFDVYADIGYPGGVKFKYFIEEWSKLNNALDIQKPEKYFGILSKLILKGVRPVDKNEPLLKTVAIEHQKNWDIEQESLSITFRDDITPSNICLQNFSPHKVLQELKDSSANKFKNTIPFLAISGWWDGEYCKSAINKYAYYNNPNLKLVIGPWDHGADFNITKSRNQKVYFDFIYHIFKFFDFNLKKIKNGYDEESKITYYVMGKNKWSKSSEWPVKFKYLEFFIHAERQLLLYKTISDENLYEVIPDSQHSTGTDTRWDSMLNPFKRKISYSKRKTSLNKCFTFQTLPIQQDIILTGSPEVILYIRCSKPSMDIFLYLDECTKEGKINYITESVNKINYNIELNKSNKNYYENFTKSSYKKIDIKKLYEIKITMLPTSFQINKESKILLSIAGFDIQHFQSLQGEVPILDIFYGKKYPSSIKLPIENYQ